MESAVTETPKAPLPNRDRKVPCPECGVLFSPRGLAGHVRLKHAGAVTSRAAARVEELEAVGSSLEKILLALEGIDRRLARLEDLAEGGADAHRSESSEIEALRGELDEVMRTIDQRKASFTAEVGHGDPERQEALRQELGALRRQQAQLLFKLGSEAPGAGVDSAEVGWGIF